MVDEYAAVVGHDHFLEESPQGLSHAVDGLTVSKRRGARNCGSRLAARSQGPATSWGRSATKA